MGIGGIWTVLCCGAALCPVFAKEETMFFQKNERAVFLGDSITHDGTYLYDILLFEALRHPDSPLRVINAGFSGDSAGGALRRLRADVLGKNPDRVFILFGMNDVGRHLYTGKNDSAAWKGRAAALENYRKNMTALVDRFLAAGKAVVLITPTPFDEYSPMPDLNCPDANESGLTGCARVVRELAEARKIKVIDLHAELTVRLRKNPSGKFTRDRVHPLSPGHLAVAAVFVSSVGESPVVASVELNAEKGVCKTAKASVQNLKISPDELSFEYLPDALPFPVDEIYLAAETFYPVTRALNQEILRVTGLTKGEYKLIAAGKTLGTFTDTAFAGGVNLALLKTPSAERAEKYKTIVSQIAALERKLRGLALLRKNVLQDKNARNTAQEYAVLEDYLHTIQTKPWHRYYSGLVEQYKTDRPKEEEIKDMLETLYRHLYRKAEKLAYPLQIVRSGSINNPVSMEEPE
ncbi:MAG: GDSL-like Lipase/Acylhydrolase [Lentisphaerae bacterium ADurb.Bin242]|nr:MAG: GDSL-like Lipase/Acylhydrolase [Lentisphaerae bacterium ADurb.Bin242]